MAKSTSVFEKVVNVLLIVLPAAVSVASELKK